MRSLAVALDPEAAADAVQEAFIAADRQWERLAPYDDAAAWVRRVAINRLLNERRDRRRRDEILATMRVVADGDLTAELIDLRRAVARLPQQMRLAICLHYLADLSVHDVAAALGARAWHGEVEPPRRAHPAANETRGESRWMIDPIACEPISTGLAPRADEAAAKALFDRRRATEPPHRGRALAAAAAVVLLAAGTVAVARITGSDTDDGGPSVSPSLRTDSPPESAPGRADAPPDPTSVTTSPTTTAPEGPAGRDFEILDVQAAADMGVLRSAVDARQLRALWRRAGLADDVPSVDFNRWVVVSIAIPDDACPPTLSDFDLDADGIRTPVFVETASSCDEPLIPKTYVVLIERAVVTPRFTLRLPGDELYGFDEQTLVIDVPPTDPAPPTTGTVQPRPPPDDVGTFPAPAPGDAESHLAPDGSPLWIVRHDDGTAYGAARCGSGRQHVRERRARRRRGRLDRALVNVVAHVQRVDHLRRVRTGAELWTRRRPRRLHGRRERRHRHRSDVRRRPRAGITRDNRVVTVLRTGRPGTPRCRRTPRRADAGLVADRRNARVVGWHLDAV
ncbi:MAG: sigma factor [Ilumatobacteraceae bacterium]